ncbi:MAG: tetratricopeptide repeat protein [Deltaproteobacteria bacterium]|nr:tetratricopeptide repeat protein [Deltaproteobacteria bacterium]
MKTVHKTGPRPLLLGAFFVLGMFPGRLVLAQADDSDPTREAPITDLVADDDAPRDIEDPGLADGAPVDESALSAARAVGVEPGAQISPEESRPPPPPTAQQVDAPTSFDAQVEALTRELDYYRSGAESFSGDMKDFIRLQYGEQKALLASQYESSVGELERTERERRMEAIERFQAFLQKYPDDPKYTPDAMFRLAELYFERSSDEYLTRSREYERQLAAFDQGALVQPPEPPQPSYERTIGLHQTLLRRFPDYRLTDAARYLLGYCYTEQGQNQEALEAYQDLVKLNPKSKLLAEVWTRIGEIYFDASDRASLEMAISAYLEVQRFPESPYYDKALYKVAWTYYRLDRFSDAVAAFIQLVDYADRQKKLVGVSGSDLRAEAIQYVAISLADEDWGGLERAKEILNPLEKKEYVGELWKRYGEILYDQTRYELAIEVLKYNLERYPNAPHNPESQERIVRAYEQLRDFDRATDARETLVATYSEGSPWAKANAGDPEALARAADLTERSLYTAAIFRHQQAQAFKKAGRSQESRTSYVAASRAYEQYLSRFPKSKNAYDFQFFLAECLYYSEDFAQAAQQYDRVRDSQLDNKHLEAAALSSVITYEKLVEQQEAQGKLPKLELLTAAQRKGRKIDPVVLGPAEQSLVDSSDRFLALLPKSDRAPAIAYRAAEVFYKHDQLDEARRRFEAIVAKYPASDVARYSSNLIIESYLAVEDWTNVERTSQRLIEVAESSSDPDTAKKQAFVESLRVFKVGAQFKQAEQFDAEGKFEDAANTYVRLVDENPAHEFADKALFNAAVAYEKVRRFDTASGIYQRIYDSYPKSALAPRALFRVGINAEKGFDFPAAVQAYTALVERYPKSENRADALYNVAVVLENQQEYQAAANAFKRYAETFPRREDAGDVFFRAALVFQKMKAWPEMIDTLDAFTTRYRNSKAQRVRLVEAQKLIGDAHAAQKDSARAQQAYAACVKEFDSRKLGVTSRAGAFAARCAFERAEAQFRSYDAISLDGDSRTQVKILNEKAKMQRLVERAYQNIFDYKRVETTLAASYRIGYSYERFAEALFAAPIPKEFRGREEYELEYKAQLEDKAAVLERKAEAAYRKAYEEAKRTRVTNEWTERILEGLNKYAPEEFPIQKRGKAVMQKTIISGNGLDNLRRETGNTTQPGASLDGPAESPTARAGGEVK